MQKQEMLELAEVVANAVVVALETKGLVGKHDVEKPKVSEKSAYAKTEALLYNYNGFKKIVRERMMEIEELRVHGVPQKCGAVGERVQNGGLPQGIVLPEESVEARVRGIENSISSVVDALNMIDKAMNSIKYDTYYKVLEMRYFEGRTQEDIALDFKCSQVTISNNKNRLVRELALRLFPNDVVKEYMGK